MKTSAAAFATAAASRRVLALAAAVLGLVTLGAAHACAQAYLTFTGGLGVPLVLKLNAPVSYAITTAGSNGQAPIFDFQNVGNVFAAGYTVSGTITFTINGGAAQTLNLLGSGIVKGSGAAADAFLDGSAPGVAAGNTVVLTAGTLTTTTNYAGAPPASMPYQTFVIDLNGTRLDAVNGVAVIPEPGTWTLLTAGTGALALAALRRRARVA